MDWQHRHTLNLNLETDLPAALRSIVPPVWETLGLFHRSSSLAESLHSWLRPTYRLIKMPQWLLPLLQLFWNHHQFERGKRSGSSPWVGWCVGCSFSCGGVRPVVPTHDGYPARIIYFLRYQKCQPISARN
ncbi:MAG: hypothetical protein HS114_14020 [Anaerolineales bacterium]|nr:hypothetical protein [Anaerolineales bacterium]